MLSTIILAGDDVGVAETLRTLARALAEPDEARIRAELQRAKARVDDRVRGIRELHFAKRFGSRGPGTADLSQYGAFKATVGDVELLAGRAFVAGNAALLVLGEEPPGLSFELAPGARVAPPEAETAADVQLPAQADGAPGGVSASMELPRSLTGRLAFGVLVSRLEAGGISGDLSAGVEQVGAGESIGTLAAPVGPAFVESAGAAIVREAAAIASSAPAPDELRRASTAWLAEMTATPYQFGAFVVSELLLGSRYESRSDLIDRLCEIEPGDVSLAAELMTRTMLLLAPGGVEVDGELIPRQEPPPPAEPVAGRRFMPIGMAISWAASARGRLLVGDEGVSQVTKQGVDYDDGVIGLIGSRAWLQVDPRLWRHGDVVRSTILEHVAPDRIVPVPKGEQAIAAGQQAIAHEQATARRSLMKALAILGATIAFVAFIAIVGNSRDDNKPAGRCATVDNGRAFRVDCSSPKASSRLLGVTSLDGSASKPCPLPTDDVVAMADAFTDYGCLRRLRPPHPGAPGGGGGILRAGDCIVDPSTGLVSLETRRGSRSEWATVAARTVTREQCPRAAVDTAEIRTGAANPVLCLARGPGIMARGDCVTDATVTELGKAPCGSPEAAFRVVARVAARSRCPARARSDTALAPRALPRAAVLCLSRL
jgi:hypothetical protein